MYALMYIWQILYIGIHVCFLSIHIQIPLTNYIVQYHLLQVGVAVRYAEVPSAAATLCYTQLD